MKIYRFSLKIEDPFLESIENTVWVPLLVVDRELLPSCQMLQDSVDRKLGPLEGMSSLYHKAIRLSLIIGCGLLFAIFAVRNFRQIYSNLISDNIWFNDFFWAVVLCKISVLATILEYL